MNKFFVIFIISLYGSALSYIERGTVWPKPQASITGKNYAVLSNSITVNSSLPGCHVLNQAIKKYQSSIYRLGCSALHLNYSDPNVYQSSKPYESPSQTGGRAMLKSLDILVSGHCQQWPMFAAETDEEYILQVHMPSLEGRAEIVANTVWGAIRALESFSQLITEIIIDGKMTLVVNSTVIIDYPRFPYRGLLLDTSRHYLPVRVILENLEAMAQNKMNVFHWHIVDDDSFPYQSQVFPDLSGQGAFDPVTHVYTADDVKEILEFARVRGIRVIPEFGTPAHTLSWGKGVPNILTPCYRDGKITEDFGPINPAQDESFNFLQRFYGEIAKTFPDKYMQLGFDQVDYACWESNPDVQSFMASYGLNGNLTKLESYYINKVMSIVNIAYNKSAIVWQDAFYTGAQLNKDTVVQVWKNGYDEETSVHSDLYQKHLSDVTEAGYNAILSSCYYLNRVIWKVDWQSFYTCDPWNFNGTFEQKALVLGGTAPMWGEYIDGVSVTSQIWARAPAVAERLWSSADVNDPDAAIPRLEEQHCRMLKRGIGIDPTVNGFCPCDANM